MYALRTEDEMKNAAEIISCGEKILKESTDASLREGAIQNLCYIYSILGNIDEAKKYAAMQGSYHTTVNQLMITLLDGEEAIKYCQRNIQSLFDLTESNVNVMIWKGKFNNSEKIIASEFVLKLYAILYDDGNYGFYHSRISKWCMTLAKCYANEQNYEKTCYYLKEAARNSIIYDTAGSGKYTSFITNRCDYKPEYTAKDYLENDSMLRLKDMSDPCYDFVRETDEFNEIITNLTKIAK